MLTPFVADQDFTLYVGDALDVLRQLPDGSVDCCVTSPPYWGLRDYGTGEWDGGDSGCDHLQVVGKVGKASTLLSDGRAHTGPYEGEKATETPYPYRDVCGKCGARRVDRQLGLEPTPAEYVERIVEVLREVRRVLAAHGTCWLNLGSSYFSEPTKGGSGPGGKNEARWSYGRASRGSDPSLSRQPERVPAYGTDGTTPQDSSALDFACRDLCDECLDDFLSHRDRTAGTPRQPSQDELPPSLTDRGNEPQGSASASPDASPLDALGSTMLQSWRRLRGQCSRCDSRASSLSGVHSSADDVPASSHMSWLNYTSRLKPKDMVPTPWMVAMALQQDGWYLRADVIWGKPNPMPESVTDRPTKAHEYLFLLSKSPRYFFDQEAVREPAEWARWGDQTVKKQQPGTASWIQPKPKQAFTGVRDARRYGGESFKTTDERNTRFQGPSPADGGRNIRSVWEIATQPFPEAHFATFPEALVERCVKAGAPVCVCTVCNTPVVSGRQQNIPEQAAVQENVRRVRQRLRGQKPELLRTDVLGESERPKAGEEEASVRDVRGADEDAAQPLLFTEMLGEVAPGKRQTTYQERPASELQGRDEAKRRLCHGSSRGPIRDAAPPCDGDDAGPEALAEGVRASSEWGQGRQSPGESRTSGAESSSRDSCLPALRRDVLDSLSPCCGAAMRPGVVLDPFSGSGTTALVARRLGRHSIGIELNAEYAAMCARRLQQLSLLAEGASA